MRVKLSGVGTAFGHSAVLDLPCPPRTGDWVVLDGIHASVRTVEWIVNDPERDGETWVYVVVGDPRPQGDANDE